MPIHLKIAPASGKFTSKSFNFMHLHFTWMRAPLAPVGGVTPLISTYPAMRLKMLKEAKRSHAPYHLQNTWFLFGFPQNNQGTQVSSWLKGPSTSFGG